RPPTAPSVPPPAEPPEAEPGEGEREGKEDPGLDQLEGPVPAGGLVVDDLADAQFVQALPGVSVELCRRIGREAGGRQRGDPLPGRIDGVARDDPGARLAG